MFGLMVDEREYGGGQILRSRALGSSLGWLLGVWLSAGGCSDDGLAPEQDDVGTTGGKGETSSVNTSATLTASASDTNNSNDSPGGTESPPDGSSGGPDATGTPDGTSGWEGSTGTTGDASGDSGPVGTTGDGEPECVASDDCNCAADEVLCEAAPPACPPGRVAEVDDGLACWTFECVPADSCTAVPDCLACTGDLACVVSVAMMGPTLTCEVVPPECMGVPTCDCMPDACVAPLECLGIPPKGDAALACG